MSERGGGAGFGMLLATRHEGANLQVKNAIFLTSCHERGYSYYMKTLPVGKLKAQFSEVLERVKQGESFGILYGKKKKPVALIIPYTEKTSQEERALGFLEGKVTVKFAADFGITEEELLDPA